MKLLVLAAGMGSRFGGIKQIAPVGPAGETLLEFNLYNAFKAGFSQAVFLIKREMEADFRKLIAERLPLNLTYEFAYQDALAGVPESARGKLMMYLASQGRIKPWGTGHALLCAQELLSSGPFATINADDFYGAEAFKVTAEFLQGGEKAVFCLPVYQLDRVLSRNGSVSRAVCRLNSSGMLKEIVEHTKVLQIDERILSMDDDGKEQTLAHDVPVSMNLWGLTPAIFAHAEALFADFIADESNWAKNEFFLPYIIRAMLKRGDVAVKALPVEDACFGLTNPDDLPEVQSNVAALTRNGSFPTPLWNKGGSHA